MQLELKHLAPYLPYSLKWMFGNTLYYTAWMSTKNISVINPKGYGELEKFRYKNIPKDLKPILRPLSDLTEEIEHNGETFVPGLMLVDPDKKEWDKMKCEFYNSFPKIPTHNKWIQVYHSDLGQVISINPKNVSHLPYNVFYRLFEWHFDVFGLIEAGAAIDKNTLG